MKSSSNFLNTSLSVIIFLLYHTPYQLSHFCGCFTENGVKNFLLLLQVEAPVFPGDKGPGGVYDKLHDTFLKLLYLNNHVITPPVSVYMQQGLSRKEFYKHANAACCGRPAIPVITEVIKLSSGF